MEDGSGSRRSCYEEDVAAFAELALEEEEEEPAADEPVPDEVELDEPEPEELAPAVAGASVDDEESDLLSPGVEADFSALTFPDRESLR